MTAGSWKAICYVFWQLVDEILHSRLFDWAIGDAQWRYRFCQWAHRYDAR